MLVSDFMVNCVLKILKGVSVECMECLTRMRGTEEVQILYIGGRDNEITTSVKLFDIAKSYGFIGDLIETITQ